MSQLLRSFYIMRKDITTYYSKPPLITWGLLFPSVMMLAIYVKDPKTYLNIAPGIVGMVLFFGSTSMAAIVFTFERRAGTFQRLLLAPVSYRTIMIGKTLGSGLYGITVSIVLTIGLILFLGMRVAMLPLYGVGLLCGAAVFSCLGMIAAVSVREVFEAMTLMNFFRFPLLFVSGVFMPIEKLPSWLLPFSFLSPLTYVIDMLRWAVMGKGYFSHPAIPGAAALLCIVLAWVIARHVFDKNALRW